jgi:hypothetical protein
MVGRCQLIQVGVGFSQNWLRSSITSHAWLSWWYLVQLLCKHVYGNCCTWSQTSPYCLGVPRKAFQVNLDFSGLALWGLKTFRDWQHVEFEVSTGLMTMLIIVLKHVCEVEFKEISTFSLLLQIIIIVGRQRCFHEIFINHDVLNRHLGRRAYLLLVFPKQRDFLGHSAHLLRLPIERLSFLIDKWLPASLLE